LISSASDFGPMNPSRVSSAYADVRVMPTVVVKVLVAGLRTLG
jgi:hypothetical protein